MSPPSPSHPPIDTHTDTLRELPAWRSGSGAQWSRRGFPVSVSRRQPPPPRRPAHHGGRFIQTEFNRQDRSRAALLLKPCEMQLHSVSDDLSQGQRLHEHTSYERI
ncbi:unnamed protein product [Pleuronectes platessa]|uniref:Uncharacterized protein n=1 Tax=Pleuronectes platessa TaxID=8262 RepID=A0A9N7VGI6_PLEPL|nr:unnamed protein product [Pleuronectes platessa]